MNRLVTWITFLAVFAMAMRPSLDSDTWWHLRAGEWILEARAVPQTDSFSYTRLGADWRYPGWLVQAPMALIYRWFGAGGLNLWTALMATLAFIFIWRRLSGGVFLRAFVTILAAAAAGIYWAARPYLVTFLLTAVFLWILEGYRWDQPDGVTGKKRLWWLPVLMIVWANSHGGFITGFILLGVYGLSGLKDLLVARTALRESKFLRLVWVGAWMILAVCLNPSGPVMLLYPFKTVSIGALGQYIQEWQPPDFHSAQVQPFVWLLLGLIGSLGISRRRIALSDFLLVAGFAYLSFNAARNIALFALAAPLVITRHAAPVMESLARISGLRSGSAIPNRRMQRLNWAILGLIVLAVLIKTATAISAEANLTEIRKTMPVEAVNFIRSTRPPGRLFNSYNWGGYLLWELPEYPVFIDGRTDLYDDEMVEEWLRVVRAETGWQTTLDQWDVRLVLVEAETPLAEKLAQEGWELLYQDGMAVVYGKATDQAAPRWRRQCN